MRTATINHFGHFGHFGPVEGLRLGYSPVGRPLMDVYCFRIGEILIDTGQSHMRAALLDFLAVRPPRHIFLTHHHEDHSGNAAAILRRWPAHLYAHPLTAHLMTLRHRILPYQHLVWGRSAPAAITPVTTSLDIGGYRFLPVHTAGHCPDHTVLIELNHGWLFSGDLFIGTRIKFFRADEKIDEQIKALKALLQHDFDAIFCGHHPCPEHGKAKICAKLQFLEDFLGSVARLWEAGWNEAAIIKGLDRGRDRQVKWLTMGNASFANMVRSAIDALSPAATNRDARANWLSPIFNGWR